MREEQSFSGTLTNLLTLPFRMAFAFLVFMVNSWTLTRPLGAFVKGFPAILAAAMLLAGLWAADFLKERRSVGASHAYRQLNLEKYPDQPERMLPYSKKLVELKPHEDYLKYQLGLDLERTGDWEGAVDVMTYLTDDSRTTVALDPEDLVADLDDEGDEEELKRRLESQDIARSDADVWLARYYQRRDLVDLGDDQREQMVIEHLESALQRNPSNTNAHLTLSVFYQSKANKLEKGTDEFNELIEKSINQLNEGIKTDFRGNLAYSHMPRLMNLLIETGEPELAKHRLRAFMDNVLPFLRRNADIYDAWRILVGCAVQLKDYDLADEIIKEGYQMAGSDEVREQIRRMSSSVVIIESDTLKDMNDEQQYSERLKLLCKAVKINPFNREAFNKLVEFALPAEGDSDIPFLRKALVSSEFPDVIHVLIGMNDISTGNVTEGQKHWRIAEQHSSDTHHYVNMVISVADAKYRDKFSNLLDMMTLAIELFPDQQNLYLTRGMYFRRNNQYREAIEDFVVIRNKVPESAQALLLDYRLLECYQGAGQTEKALATQQVIDEALLKLDPKTRERAVAAMEAMGDDATAESEDENNEINDTDETPEDSTGSPPQ